MTQVPLRSDERGALRIGPSRVSLDTLIGEFHAGASPEEMVEHFPTLDLADVYSVIGFYLGHRAEVDAYLAQRRAQAEEYRREYELEHPPQGLRAGLLARRAANS